MIVTNGLVAYYNSKQGISGTTWANLAPDTLGSYDATLFGPVAGPDGLYFNGAGDYAEIPLPTEFQTPGDVTFEFRMKVVSRTGNEVISDGTSDYMLYVSEDAVRSSGIFNTSRSDFTESLDDAGPGDMILTILSDATNGLITYYINGAKVAEETATVDTIVPSNLMRLGSHTTDYSPEGVIDSVRFYNRLLTEAEIQQNVDEWSNVGLGNDPTYTVSGSNSITEDFEDATFQFDFDGDWTVTTAQFQEGASSYASATITDAQTSAVTFHVSLPYNAIHAHLQFQRQLSTEADFDFFYVYINDALWMKASGDIPWTLIDLPLHEQENTIEFRYVKDSTTSYGDDRVYVDALSAAWDLTNDISNYVGILKVEGPGGAVEIPYYNPADVADSSIRVGANGVYALNLLPVTSTSKVRARTSAGVRAIETL